MELFECLDAVERDAKGALGRDRQPVLFHRLSWFRLLQEHCPPPGKLLVARAENDAGERSWLFLARQGGRASAYANWYSLAFGFVHEVPGEPSRRSEAAIARALRAEALRSVHLYPMRAAGVGESFGTGGWWTSERADKAAWVADVSGMSFDDYWAGRPPSLRNTARRKAKEVELNMSIYSSFEAKAWSEYEAVYRASWKPDEGSPAFLRALAAQEGAAGTLRLGIARREGEPVAAQFWLTENGRATIHKLAYREDAKAWSPGTLLSTAMFRHAIDVDRVAVIDFGLGDEPYKADWMTRREPVASMTAYNLRSARGLAGAARELVRRLRNH